MSGSWSNNATTSLTLPTGAVPPQQRITLDGGTDTILVYSATGALIASIAATAGTDGLGNSYPAGISSTGGVVSQSIILLYSGTPAAGNLVASMSSNGGTDSFGNQYTPGLGTYDHTNNSFVEIEGGAVVLGPIIGGTPAIGDAASIEIAGNGLQIQTPLTTLFQDSVLMQMLTGAFGTGTGGANVPQVTMVAQAFDSDVDVLLPGTVIRTTQLGVAYTWQTPSAAAGFAQGSPALRYRLDALNNVVYSGELSYTGANVTNAGLQSNVLSAAVPAVYQPTVETRGTVAHYTSTGVQKNIGTTCRVRTDGTLALQWGDGVAGSAHDVTALATGDLLYFNITAPMANIS